MSLEVNESLPLILAIDTSTSTMAAALLEGDRLAGESHKEGFRNHSIHLVPAVEEMLSDAGYAMHQIKGVAVGRGPGSYTGIRIGVTAAKVWAWSLQVPLIGVSTLETIAEPFREPNKWIVPLLDARRGQAYTALYGETTIAEDGIRLADDWLGEIEGMLEKQNDLPKQIVFAGEIEPFAEQLAEFQHRLGNQVDVQVEKTTLHAQYTARLAQRRWMNEGQDDPHLLVPNYTQMAEAEAKLLSRNKAGV